MIFPEQKYMYSYMAKHTHTLIVSLAVLEKLEQSPYSKVMNTKAHVYEKAFMISTTRDWDGGHQSFFWGWAGE